MSHGITAISIFQYVNQPETWTVRWTDEHGEPQGEDFGGWEAAKAFVDGILRK
jgi:hypothetical protein